VKKQMQQHLSSRPRDDVVVAVANFKDSESQMNQPSKKTIKNQMQQ
jgi:hypothetical protein